MKRVVERCPISGAEAEFYCDKPPASYYRTPSLGLIYQKEVPSVAEMSEYAEKEYAGGVYKDYAAAGELKIATFHRRLALLQQLGAKGRLLDVGCACGFLLEAALEHGFDPYGIEFSQEAVSLAKEHIKPRITIGDVNLLRERGDRKFDVVVAFDIIEHTQSPIRFLQDIRNILQPNGWLLVATPDTGHVLRYVMGCRWPMLQPMQHTYLFSRAAMAFALEKAGYEKVDIRSADKSLTLDYLLEQVRSHNPLLKGIYDRVAPFVPRSLRARRFAVNIGEMLAVARPKPPSVVS